LQPLKTQDGISKLRLKEAVFLIKEIGIKNISIKRQKNICGK
jgi:hypothetical protein